MSKILNEIKGSEHKVAGYEAARTGTSRWKNPNEKGSKQHKDWTAGHETFKANQKMSYAWADGFGASRDGKTEVVNPHTAGTQLYHSWLKGFADHKGKDKKKKKHKNK